MTTAEYPYAGLILPDACNLDPAPYVDTAARVLARLDPVPAAQPHRSAHGNKVFGRRFGAIVIPEEDSDYGPRMVIEIVAANGTPPDPERAARLLSDIVLECLNHSDADILEWYAPDVLLDREDFIRLRSYVSPKRMQDVDADMEDVLFENEALNTAIRDALYGRPSERGPTDSDDPGTRRLRFQAADPDFRRQSVAGYLLTGFLGTVFFPVAVLIYVLTIWRGMDLRRVSQAMAVTALFAALYHADRLGGALKTMVH